MQRFLRTSLFVLGGAALSYACTFGANDFKLVPETNGSGGQSGDGAGGGSQAGSNAGSGTSGGTTSIAGSNGKAGGSTTGGAGNVAGQGSGGAAAGSSGSGGSGGAGVTLTCSNLLPKPLTAMTAAQLYNASSNINSMQVVTQLDATGVPTGNTYIIVTVQIPVDATNPSLGNTTHLLIRTVTDSGSGALHGLTDVTLPSYFQYGSGWVTGTTLEIVGGLGGYASNSNSVVQLSFPLQNNDANGAQMTTTRLSTPMDCQNGMRDVAAANGPRGVSYAVTCMPYSGNQDAFSLWVNTPTLGAITNIGMANASATDSNPDINNIVRGFISDGMVSLIFVGQEVGPTSSFRIGPDAMGLSHVQTLSLSTDASLWEGIIATPAPPPDGGVFLVGASLRDPTVTMDPTPVNILAGTVAASDYPTLTAVPPAQLTHVTTFASANDVEFPADVSVRNNTAYVAASNPLLKKKVYLWALDTGGGPLEADFTVFDGDDTVGAAGIGRFALSVVVAWVDTDANGTYVYAAPISCFQ